MNSWIRLEEGLHLYRDSCQVYAVRGREDHWLIINAGTGAAADHLAELGALREVTVVLTHHFRDHSAGAEKFRRRGARVFAPYGEREHLAGDQWAFRAKQTYFLYDLRWDNFAPIEPLVIDRWLMDYERTTLAGLPVEVIPAPGVTLGASAYALTLSSGRKIVFCGELMASPGRLARLSPLQYNYNDLTGGENVLFSWDRVLAARPDEAFPSLGEPFRDIPAAVVALRRNLAEFDRLQPGFADRATRSSATEIEEVIPRLYRARNASAETHFIVGRSGRILALDYGYDTAGIHFPQRLDFSGRRTLLHSFDALRAKTGAERIDTVLATHYHDDHVAGVRLLQRLFGTELWAGENFADLLENPADHDRPCLWPDPMKVTRRLPLGEKFHWEDVAVTLHPMSGHTEFSTLICLEFDGHRLAHTGDQLFFLNARGELAAPQDSRGVFTNHVYRNGLALGGYADCVRRLRDFDPELILSGHWKPYRPTAETWEMLETAGRDFDRIHRALLPLGDEEAHFGPEGQAAKLQPYHLHLSASESSAPLHGWVLNPYNRPATAELSFTTPPPGWSVPPLRLALGAREKRPFATQLTITPAAPHPRQPIALELTVEGRRFGQVAEAWVTID